MLSPPEADEYSIVAYLRIKKAKLAVKDATPSDWLDRVTIPPLSEEAFEDFRPVIQDDLLQPSTSAVSLDDRRLPITTIYQGQDLNEDILAQSRSCLKQVLGKYTPSSSTLQLISKPAECSLSSLCHINVFLSSMSDFTCLNQAFLETFASQPPTRACVAVNLPKGVLVRMDVLRHAGSRKVMHVQSLSYWAPANIGPYSQANLVSLAFLPWIELMV